MQFVPHLTFLTLFSCEIFFSMLIFLVFLPLVFCSEILKGCGTKCISTTKNTFDTLLTFTKIDLKALI
jgi:hypothetical protein